MIQLRPSSSYRWTRCAASPTFEAACKIEPDSDAAREGTCAAWLADCVLKGSVPTAATMTGESHSNGWIVTPDMAFHIQKYVDLIRSYGGTVTTEQFVRLTEWIGGTLDSSIAAEIETSSDILRLKDLKYGMLIVEIYENPQLMIYAGAELLRLNNPSIRRVELAIYQPRAFHPEGIHRTWTLTVEELWERLQWIVERGAECQKPNPVATPGRQCDHCRARTSCVALAHSNYRNYAIIEDRRQRHMTSDELAIELNFLDDAARVLNARKNAIEAEAKERMNQGDHLRGWIIKTGKGHRQFKYPAATIHAFTGIDPHGDAPTVTPAELERRGASPDVLALLTYRPDTSAQLKRMGDDYLAKAFAATKG